MSMTTNILPPNATSAEIAMERATNRVAHIPVNLINACWNPATCPAAVLPWLAWALAVDSWDPTWSDDIKRATIAQNIAVLRRKGTIGALKTALAAVGYGATVVESTTTPFTFSVSLDGSLGGTGGAIPYAAAQDIALRVKPARSKLIDISVLLNSATATLQAGIALSTGVTLHLATP